VFKMGLDEDGVRNSWQVGLGFGLPGWLTRLRWHSIDLSIVAVSPVFGQWFTINRTYRFGVTEKGTAVFKFPSNGTIPMSDLEVRKDGDKVMLKVRDFYRSQIIFMSGECLIAIPPREDLRSDSDFVFVHGVDGDQLLDALHIASSILEFWLDHYADPQSLEADQARYCNDVFSELAMLLELDAVYVFRITKK